MQMHTCASLTTLYMVRGALLERHMAPISKLTRACCRPSGIKVCKPGDNSLIDGLCAGSKAVSVNSHQAGVDCGLRSRRHGASTAQISPGPCVVGSGWTASDRAWRGACIFSRSGRSAQLKRTRLQCGPNLHYSSFCIGARCCPAVTLHMRHLKGRLTCARQSRDNSSTAHSLKPHHG